MSKATLVPFDAVDYLESEEDIALYLNAILEDGSPMEIAAALGDVARARGMAKVAADAGLSRESLYRGLSGSRVPTADTLLRVIRALGMKLSVDCVKQ
jgi:probable addiction module antidote protein